VRHKKLRTNVNGKEKRRAARNHVDKQSVSEGLDQNPKTTRRGNGGGRRSKNRREGTKRRKSIQGVGRETPIKKGSQAKKKAHGSKARKETKQRVNSTIGGGGTKNTQCLPHNTKRASDMQAAWGQRKDNIKGGRALESLLKNG